MPGIQALHIGFNRLSSSLYHPPPKIPPPPAPHRFIKRRHWNLQRPGHAGTDLGGLKVRRMSNVLGGGLLSRGGRDLGEAARSPADGQGSNPD